MIQSTRKTMDNCVQQVQKAMNPQKDTLFDNQTLGKDGIDSSNMSGQEEEHPKSMAIEQTMGINTKQIVWATFSDLSWLLCGHYAASISIWLKIQHISLISQ